MGQVPRISQFDSFNSRAREGATPYFLGNVVIYNVSIHAPVRARPSRDIFLQMRCMEKTAWQMLERQSQSTSL